MRRISPQSPQNGKKSHPIAPEGKKCLKIAKNEPENAQNGPKTAVFGLGGILEVKNRGFWQFRTRCGSLPTQNAGLYGRKINL